ncbi:MAG: hypothetical protein KDA63_00125 [Planctomycetales bacterium]|nr:hypothetical protein [Planctomycetales bacterium]
MATLFSLQIALGLMLAAIFTPLLERFYLATLLAIGCLAVMGIVGLVREFVEFMRPP